MREVTQDYIMRTSSGKRAIYKNITEVYAQDLCKHLDMLIEKQGKGLELEKQ